MVANQMNMSQTSLDAILELHTRQRMKIPEKEDAKQKRGGGLVHHLTAPSLPLMRITFIDSVSIASQRRFLMYWSILLLSPKDVPRGFWADPPLPVPERPKVYIREVRVRLRESNLMARKAIRAVNSVFEMAGKSDDHERGKGEIWISLARYEDAFVEVLEECERRTRGKTIGKRSSMVPDTEVVADTQDKGVDVGVHGILEEGKWDSKKMVKSFARMGENDPENTKVEKLEVILLLAWPSARCVLLTLLISRQVHVVLTSYVPSLLCRGSMWTHQSNSLE